MSEMITVRLDERELRELEAVRDPRRYPTRSDFVREAIRKLVREERRNNVRAEIAAANVASGAVPDEREFVDADTAEWFARLDAADRGEL